MSLIRIITRTFIIIFCLIPSLVLASEIVLKSGQKLEGKIIEQTDKYIKLDTGLGIALTYYADEIDAIDGNKFQPLTHSDLRPVPTGTDSCKVDDFSVLLTGKDSLWKDKFGNEPVPQCQSIMTETKTVNNSQECYKFFQELGQRCCPLVKTISSRDQRIGIYYLMVTQHRVVAGAPYDLSQGALCGSVYWNADGTPKLLTPGESVVEDRMEETKKGLAKVPPKVKADLETLQRAVEAYKDKTNTIPLCKVSMTNATKFTLDSTSNNYSLASTYLVSQFIPSPLNDPFSNTPDTEYFYSHYGSDYYAICSQGFSGGKGNLGWQGKSVYPPEGVICITNGSCGDFYHGICLENVLTPAYSASQAAQSTQQSHYIDPEYSGIFDCAQKMYPESMAPFFSNHDYSLVVLDTDLMYILDKKKGKFYVLTPYFTGKTDLLYDKDGKRIGSSNANSYNVRISYLPSDPSKQRGYYYDLPPTSGQLVKTYCVPFFELCRA